LDVALRNVVASLPDRVTGFIGSWRFVVGGLAFILVWAMANVTEELYEGWDPYPFVFLNLMIGIQAAFIGPIIMMSQRQQEERDKVMAVVEAERVRRLDEVAMDIRKSNAALLAAMAENELRQSVIIGRLESIAVDIRLRQGMAEEAEDDQS
jgi:uncharacterized membrane protein